MWWRPGSWRVDLIPFAPDSDARRPEARSIDQGEQAAEVAPHTTAGTEQVAGEPRPIESVSARRRSYSYKRSIDCGGRWALLGVALIVFIVGNTQKVQGWELLLEPADTFLWSWQFSPRR